MKNIAMEWFLKEMMVSLKKWDALSGVDDSTINIIIKKLVEDWLPTQQEVDMLMNGDNVYLDLVSNVDKPINYGLCISSELAELLDSIPWKHWKNVLAKADLDNYETELVDLLHFLPATMNVLLLRLLAVSSKTPMQIQYIPDQHTMYTLPIDKSKYDLYKLTSWFMVGLGADASLITGTFNALLDDEKALSTEAKYDTLAVAFLSIVKVFKLHSLVFETSMEESIEKLWSVYLVKNVLNVFRVMNGYKEGTYIKMWNGIEDNAVVKKLATEIRDNSNTLDKELLYAKTEEFYKGLSK